MTNINWTPVESSNIDALAHQEGEMFVRFKNSRVYSYRNVSKETFEEVLGGASIGRTFNQLIKSHPESYPYRAIV